MRQGTLFIFVGKLPAGSVAVKPEGEAEVQASRAAARVESCNVGENEATEAKPADFAVGHRDEDEIEEPEELRKVTVGLAPTERQRRQHEEEYHSVYREWCEVYVVARGTGAQHQHRRKRHQIDQEQRGPRIFSDLFFHEHSCRIDTYACVEILKIVTNCSDGTAEQGSDRIWGKILRWVHREIWRQEIHQLQRQ